MPRSSARPARSRSSSLGLRVGVVALALAALWSAGWFIAARLAGSGLDDWFAREASAGRQWTCPARRIEGYPLGLSVHCDRPTFRGEIAGHTSAGVVEGLTAAMTLERPGTLVVDLRGPLNLRAEDDTFIVELSWAGLGLAVPGVFGIPTGGSIAADRLAVSGSARGQGDLNLRVAHLTGEAAAVGDDVTDKSFAFMAEAVTFPTLDPIPGLEMPADAAGQGVLVAATLLTAPTVARLEAWRQAGGALRLAALSMAKGPFSGEAHGMLALDAAHRPAGRLDTSLKGFGPIAQHFGIPVAGIELGGLLTNLLGGGKAAPAEKGSVQLPLVFADGGVSVGPIATGVRLAPLY